MYDCDKGYFLSDRGPMGATCVAGVWRPIDMPHCLPALHPRLRWTRRRRSLDDLPDESELKIRNYRQLKKKIDDMLKTSDQADFDNIMRSKRGVDFMHRQRKFRSFGEPLGINRHWASIRNALKRFKRSDFYYDNVYRPSIERAISEKILRQHRNRHYDDQEEEPNHDAYMRFYEKIKQKHRNYISNLLKASHANASHRHDEHGRPQTSISRSIPSGFDDRVDFDGFRQNQAEDSSRASSIFDEINAFGIVPIPLPNINEKSLNRFHGSKKTENPFVNNTYVGNRWKGNAFNGNTEQRIFNNEFLPKLQYPMNRRNFTQDFISQLASQLQRRKRSADDTESEANKKARSREPCEVSVSAYFQHRFEF